MLNLKEKRLFNVLIDDYGFVIEEFSEGLNSYWVALKYASKGIIAVICTNEEEEQLKISGLNYFLSQKGVPYIINAVVFTDQERNPYGNVLVQENNDNNYNRLLVNLEDEVISYSRGMEFIARIISQGYKVYVEKNEVSKTTIVLIAINVIMFLISAYLSKSIFDINTYVLYILGAKENVAIAHGEYFRLLTAAFLHGGLIHLVVNMYALNALGGLIDKIYGVKKYLVIYFVSALSSSYLSYLMSDYLSIGASGAIFGLMGGAIVFAIKEKDKIGKGFLSNLLSVVALNIFLGLTQSNIDNFGHFGGLIGGIVIALIIYPRKNRNMKINRGE